VPLDVIAAFSRLTVGLRVRVLLLGDVANQIRLCLTQGRLILGKICLRLIEHGVERPRIDGEQQIPRFDVVACAEMHLRHRAAHLCLHGDGGISLDVADHLDLQRHILLHHRGDSDGHAALAFSYRLRAFAGATRKRQQQARHEGTPQTFGAHLAQ